MLAKNPAAAKPLGAFLEILAGTLEFPQPLQFSPPQNLPQTQPDTQPLAAVPRVCGNDQQLPQPQPDSAVPGGDWIPILGRSAAGVSQFWDADDDTAGLTTLAELIEKHTAAVVAAADDEQMDVRGGEATGDLNPLAAPELVQIITLRTPADKSGVAEFVAAPRIKAVYPDAFAVRIDGESMSPEIRHGDLLILSPSVSPASGAPAVVQIRDAIGVTCKLYQPSAVAPNVVSLVAINEQFASRTIKLDEIQWALSVISKIRSRP